MKVLQPPGWPRPRGYANGVVARGQLIFVAGMVGWDTDNRFVSDTLAGQARQALANVVAVLAEAGARPEHIVRMTWYVTDKREYLASLREIGQAFRELIGSFQCAMTAVEVTALIEDQAKVEIEVTAVLPD
jgi:enamine deaminase RidA (YjgF/YER057c/UK114 family)